MSVVSNIWNIKDLRKRILFTLGLIFICRFVATVPTPGVNTAAIGKAISEAESHSGGGLMGMFNLFSGGALGLFAVGTLNIWPYISAQIIIQLMTAVIPSLERMAREGDVGRQRLNQVTRYLTLVLCAGQSLSLAIALEQGAIFNVENPVYAPGWGFRILTMLCMTSATMFFMWLAEQMTQRGIGNGGSMIIMINIVSRLPFAIGSTWVAWKAGQLDFIRLALLLILAFFVFAGTVALTLGVRRVPIHTARRSIRGGMGGSGLSTSYMPLRVNFSGVMPIIFAGPILMAVAWVCSHCTSQGLSDFVENAAKTGNTAFSVTLAKGALWCLEQLQSFGAALYSSTSGTYLVCYALLILFFSFFWVATQFNAVRTADDLKRSGGYVPGIRPGLPTAEFLDDTMTRVTLIGAVGLVIVAVLPAIIQNWLKAPPALAGFLGGTSLLIIIGVALDTMRQIESFLVVRDYDGFLKHGHLRGRRG